MATNRDVLAMLSELVTLTTLEEESPQSFKVRAYENARLGIEAHGGDVTEMTVTELTKIKGVGKATASKIRELVDNGTVAKVETLRESYPPAFVELTRIPGLGPKTLKNVREHLGVTDVASLKKAVEDEQLRTIPGLGATSEKKIAKAIERLGLTGKDRRTPIAEALPLAERLVDTLAAVDGVVEAQYCGSLRRFSETIGDIDITVASNDPTSVMEVVRGLPDAVDIVVSGDTKTSFLTPTGLQIDVRVVAPEQFGAATLYFTGSKAHNIALRQLAINKGWLLNEYGLIENPKPDPDADPEAAGADGADGDESDAEVTDPVVIASATEGEIYDALGLAFVPPTMRESTGEVDAAASGALPELVQREHLRGDLHYHTDRSGDGRSPLPDMVQAAADLGYEYVAITEHGIDLSINGVNAEDLLKHRDDIAALQPDYPDMTLLWGCELNIGPDGGLDYDADYRALMDYTVASVHSHYDLSITEQTDRMIAAIADPTVDSIGHLTGRYIGRRPGIELDYEAMFDALLEHDVALEINGALQRLDAAADVVRRAVDRGIKIVINTDSHHVSELGRMDYGVLTAQRGWVPKDLVINTWERERFLGWLADRRGVLA